jgi:hypothetical protein
MKPVRIIWDRIWFKCLIFWHLANWVSRIERFMLGLNVGLRFKADFIAVEVEERGFPLVKFIIIN